MKKEKYTCTKTGKILDKETYYYESGKVKRECYHLNGKYHREDGPAIIWYYKSGKVDREYYRLNGKLHREDGPAYVSYYESGEVRSEYYYLNGKECTEIYHNNKWMKIHLKKKKYVETEKYLYTEVVC